MIEDPISPESELGTIDPPERESEGGSSFSSSEESPIDPGIPGTIDPPE